MNFVIVLDIDDTVYLERDFALSGYRHLDGWISQTRGVEGFSATCRTLFEAGERRHIFDLALEKVGLRADPDLITDLVARYRGHVPQIQPCDDVQRFLALTPPIFRIGVITDGPAAMQLAKVQALGLDRHAGKVIATGLWPAGQGKPHPRAFIEMEGWSTLPPERHVYVADNATKDFVAPNSRGWVTVQICRPGRIHLAEPPDARHAAQANIVSFDELFATLVRTAPGIFGDVSIS